MFQRRTQDHEVRTASHVRVDASDCRCLSIRAGLRAGEIVVPDEQRLGTKFRCCWRRDTPGKQFNHRRNDDLALARQHVSESILQNFQLLPGWVRMLISKPLVRHEDCMSMSPLKLDKVAAAQQLLMRLDDRQFHEGLPKRVQRGSPSTK